MNHQSVDLGKGPVGKLLFSLALPTITSQIVNMLYNLVDRVYIGHMTPADTVGRLALTGVGVCLPVILVISAFAALLAMGGAPRASIAEGRNNPTESERIMGNCLTMLVVASLVLTAVLRLFAEPLLLTFGASDNTIGYALDYMNIYALGTVFVQVTLGMNAYITAQGFTTVSMRTVLIGAILNTILDPIFIFGLNMGIRGAALATILSQAVSAIWVLRFLTGERTRWRIRRENLRPQASVVLPCLALGLSPFIMQSTESLIAICFNSSLLKYGGDLAVGAMTVLTSLMQFAMMPLHGLTQGAQPIVSYNYGARNAERVRAAFKALLKACFTYSMVMWVLVQLFPRAFIMLFNSDPQLLDYAAWALRVYMGATGIFGIQIACQQTFIALGNAKASLFLAVLRKIILLIPLIYILPHFFADQAFAVFLAEPVADFLAVCTTAGMFAVQFKKSMRALEAPGSSPA
ncbi:putative efflux protein, MATE family [Oscillibacter sp. PC13]|uniref:MATE family efflux transporter n=1 Tax=Oscillibacter sp. PC13 TaxID=1855299 RepID=UPI0008E89BD6|nr:MATE family efflux transporter [Oscillibacter sp. PC13]SFP65829.1 putative efflux protein, MATE family [Oscillibacter sp. PC13]